MGYDLSEVSLSEKERRWFLIVMLFTVMFLAITYWLLFLAFATGRPFEVLVEIVFGAIEYYGVREPVATIIVILAVSIPALWIYNRIVGRTPVESLTRILRRK